MACRLFGHYVNQCWLIFNWTLMNTLQLISNESTKMIFMKIHLQMPSAKWRSFCPGKHSEIYGEFTQIPVHVTVVFWSGHTIHIWCKTTSNLISSGEIQEGVAAVKASLFHPFYCILYMGLQATLQQKWKENIKGDFSKSTQNNKVHICRSVLSTEVGNYIIYIIYINGVITPILLHTDTRMYICACIHIHTYI